MNEILNPYIAGAPVTETSMFFGREEVFRWIERSLAGKYVDHILVLHGQRRVGKTSVLKQIPNFLGEQYIQVFFDFQGRTNTTLNRFLWWLARETTRTLTRKHGFDLPRPNRKAFEEDTEYLITEFFPSLRPLLKGRMLLLTFDEFDTLAREDIQENFAKPLIAYLRRLMDLEGLNFIFSIGSSGNKLENMQASYTDFFKAALYRKISFLDKKNCRQLIVAPVEGVISYDRRAINKIYLITAGHPYFTQLMCHELFSLCQKTGTREIGQEDVESVVNDVIERGTVNLKFVWDEASDLEKWILAGLAQQTEETSNQKLAQFLREQSVRFVESDLNSGVLHLRDKDVLTKDNSFVVHLMRLWLQKNRPLDRVREELTEINPIANRFIEIGDEYRAREQVEQALDSYRRAVEAAPEYLKAQLSIAMTLFENKEYQEAVQAFEKSLEIDPADVAAQTGLCDSLLGLGDKALTSEDEEQAIAHYQQILTLNQSHTDARQRLANIHKTQGEELLKSGRDDEALSVLNQALRYTPEDEKLSARYNQVLEEKRAKVIAEWLKKTERALERQRWEEAASFVEEALRLDPENQDLQAKRKEVKDAPRQFKLGQYKVKAERALVKENFEKAITAIENAILLAPEDQNLKKWLKSTRSDQLQKQLQIYREQAEKAIANGEWNAAIATRKEALKLSPNDTQLAQELENTKAAKLQAQLDTFKLRAETAIKNKDWETALKAWENAIALAPDDPVWAAKLDETKQAKRKAKLDAFQSQADKAVANEAWDKAIRAIQGAIELAPEDDVWKEKLTAIKTAQRQAQLTAYYTQATEARARGDWATSIAALEDYLSLAPDDANIQNEIEAIREEQRQQKLATFKSKAQTATTEEKWTEAVQAWENYLQLDPEDAVTGEEQLQHARKYAEISSNYVEAEKALRKKNYGRAVNLLQGIIAQDPTYKSTSRLLVEAVEAKGQAPVWQSPWVYGGLGAVVVVVLGILFGPRLIKTIPSMLATDRPTSTNTLDPTAPLDLTTTPMSTPTAPLDLTITPMLTPTAPLDLTITPASTPTTPLTSKTVTPAEEETATPTEETLSVSEAVRAYIAEESPTFEDDFSVANTAWGSLGPEEYNYRVIDYVENGVLSFSNLEDLELGESGQQFGFPDNGLFNATNFAISYKFKSIPFQKNYGVGLGLQFRASSNGESYLQFIINQDTRNYRLIYKHSSTYDRVEEGNIANSPQALTEVLILAYNENITIYVNGTQLTSVDYPAIPGDFNTLLVSNFQTLTVDDVQFWNLDGVEIDIEEETTTPTEEAHEVGDSRVSSVDGMTQLYVPAGEFEMGEDAEAHDYECDESSACPQHEVYLDAFWIDQTEVTNAMYARFLNESEREEQWIAEHASGFPLEINNGQWQPKNGYENHPMTEVTWFGAQAYCEWAGRRLPTEAEWEKAARGMDGREYPWGNLADSEYENQSGKDRCLTLLNSVECNYRTMEVGQLEDGKSPYGVYNMIANVKEWVADWYGEDYYQVSPASNPTGPADGFQKAVRGGSWKYEEQAIYERYWFIPYSSNDFTGFRCAMSSESP